MRNAYNILKIRQNETLKRATFILFCLVLLISCDIPKTLSLRNRLNKPILPLQGLVSGNEMK
jgi:hypothetical protein